MCDIGVATSNPQNPLRSGRERHSHAKTLLVREQGTKCFPETLLPCWMHRDFQRQGVPRVSKTIVIDDGDCFINLSKQEGFFWETVWNHPENRELRTLRKNPNILKKGDQ